MALVEGARQPVGLEGPEQRLRVAEVAQTRVRVLQQLRARPRALRRRVDVEARRSRRSPRPRPRARLRATRSRRSAPPTSSTQFSSPRPPPGSPPRRRCAARRCARSGAARRGTRRTRATRRARRCPRSVRRLPAGRAGSRPPATAQPGARRRRGDPRWASQQVLEADERRLVESATRRTASSTPGMNDSRLSESWRIVSVWPRPPRMTSWCATSPGRRTEWIGTSPSISGRISAAVRAAVPLGASSLRSWCSSMISASGCARAASAAKRIISTAPIAKFGATKTFAPRSRAQRLERRSRSSR